MIRLKNYKKVTYHIILLIIGVLFLACALQTVSAADITISDSDSGGILGAVNDSGVNSGDTVFLTSGTYNKTNEDTNITISKSITLQGNGPTNQVIIDGKGLTGIFNLANNINVTFINITFTNGNTLANGGAIYNPYTNTTLTFINCTFTNNSASARNTGTNDGDGGAIYNNGNNLAIINSNFNNNNAEFGGAICNNGTNSSIVNSNFNNNSASSDGGAIYNDGNELSISSSTFKNNNADGGGVIFNNGNNTTINNSNFNNNDAESGGAIYNWGLGFVITNSVFRNNDAESGGAIYNDDDGDMSIIGSTFIRNHASEIGGGIFNSGNMLVSGNTMTANTAGELGNVIFNDGTMGVLTLTFLSNTILKVKKNTPITIYATLTDDMGNPVTGGEINFYINGKFIGTDSPEEGKAKITFTPTKSGIVSVTGSYSGAGSHAINIKTAKIKIIKNNENTIGKADMKNTGIPIITILLVLITLFTTTTKTKK